ncbi:2-succinyl-5-enolpyruvyl-6-hydroxy-3-cyclohexene-1-carboxylic-acid synthase [Candidatus Providencia siddallii]|uniref:2-succinyl-5-enolpyruvyl-6-hydroxy-3-cyclohexene-1-carboxylate synthase n=1 Tax=Candidatus Providencia siddallii TaxID=1715285 RepID=A0ABM9NNN9_9GAMM
MSSYSFNISWAEVIIESLVRHEMKYICIAPGSRSTPLIIAAAKNKKLICYTHFDERGFGFFALGIAKAKKKPVGIIVTSGTAVANLYPSLIEASMTGEKIIFITADRPPELIGCGANQSIKQSNIFSSYPMQTLMLPRPTEEISAKWLVSSIDDCMNRLNYGVFHINCPFAEPLYGEIKEHDSWKKSLNNWWDSKCLWLKESYINKMYFVEDWYFWRQKKGILVIGKIDVKDSKYIIYWGKKLGWPIIGDVLSQIGQPYPCADLWLNHPLIQNMFNEVELVIQFGSNLTGKYLLNWLSNCNPKEYWIVDLMPQRLNFANHRGRKFTCSIKSWLDNNKACFNYFWCEKLFKIVQNTKKYVHNQLNEKLSEAAIAYQLPKLLPQSGQLFIGNSLILRLINAFAQLPISYPVYSNSGVKGIDGLISTMAGIQMATKKPTLGIIGDLSALYDLNSLILLRKPFAPIVLIIINNNGGQIFSMLPTPKDFKKKFFCIPQNINFKYAAKMFNLEYYIPNTWLELKSKIDHFWFNKSHTLLVELIVNDDEGVRVLKQLMKEVVLL